MSTLGCPVCGKPAIAHWEEIPVRRSVLENLDEDGVLVIEGLIDEKGYESGQGERLSCANDHEFPIPEEQEVRYT